MTRPDDPDETREIAPWANKPVDNTKTIKLTREGMERMVATMGRPPMKPFEIVSPTPPPANLQQSSNRHDWETPPSLFRLISEAFGPFDLDAAASDSNHLCERYYTEADDALRQPWIGKVWCNPPYGEQLGKFVEKAFVEVRARRASVVMLFPPRTDTAWWHKYVMRASGIYPVKGRVSFCLDGVPQNNNTFPSALVHFSPRHRSIFRAAHGPTMQSFCQRCGLDCVCDRRPELL